MFKTTVGAKMVMAVTGLGLFGFVIVHMLGNLQVFLGAEALNSYAHKLHSLPLLVWAARIGLLAIFLLHMVAATQLARRNREARPIAYQHKEYVVASMASRTMLLSGLLVLAFVAYHLAHFTFQMVHIPEHLEAKLKDGTTVPDVYSMVVHGFRNWLVSGSYVLAQIVLGLHLSHGVSSMFQTFGLRVPQYRKLIDGLGPLSAAIVVVGNSSIPVAIMVGLVPPTGGVATGAM